MGRPLLRVVGMWHREGKGLARGRWSWPGPGPRGALPLCSVKHGCADQTPLCPRVPSSPGEDEDEEGPGRGRRSRVPGAKITSEQMWAD